VAREECIKYYDDKPRIKVLADRNDTLWFVELSLVIITLGSNVISRQNIEIFAITAHRVEIIKLKVQIIQQIPVQEIPVSFYKNFPVNSSEIT